MCLNLSLRLICSSIVIIDSISYSFYCFLILIFIVVKRLWIKTLYKCLLIIIIITYYLIGYVLSEARFDWLVSKNQHFPSSGELSLRNIL